MAGVMPEPTPTTELGEAPLISVEVARVSGTGLWSQVAVAVVPVTAGLGQQRVGMVVDWSAVAAAFSRVLTANTLAAAAHRSRAVSRVLPVTAVVLAIPMVHWDKVDPIQVAMVLVAAAATTVAAQAASKAPVAAVVIRIPVAPVWCTRKATKLATVKSHSLGQVVPAVFRARAPL